MKRLLLLCLCFALALSPLACKRESAVSAVDFVCDTVVTITAYASQETVDEAIRLCRAYERRLSKTIEDSDVWNLNHANGAPITVDSETAALLQLAKTVAEASDGAFDVTIAPASALWNFTKEPPTLPDAALLEETLRRVGDENLVIDGNTVTLLNGAEIDLGGIAKGYIADCAASYLKENGVRHACINMGGNIVVFGGKPDGSPWTIGIRDPNGAPDESAEIIRLTDGVLVTSGNYERFFELDGVRYHHILDPQTGMPVQNGLASVTILAETSALSDALSTACFVLGEKAAKPLLDRFKARAIFLRQDGARSEYP